MWVDLVGPAGAVAVLAAAPLSRFALGRHTGTGASSVPSTSCSGRTGHGASSARLRNNCSEGIVGGSGGRRVGPSRALAALDDAERPPRRSGRGGKGRRAKASGASSPASTSTASSGSGSSDGDADVRCRNDDDDDLIRRMGALVAMSTDQTPAAVTKLLRDDDATYRALAREADAAGDGADGPERRIAQNLLFLSHELGCDADDLAAIVRAFPGVLTLDADDDMRVVVAFLTGPIPTGGVGMTVAAARECVRRDPKMLAQSVKNKLSPKFEYLVEHAGLRPGNVGDMLRLDLETQIKPRVQFLALTCGMGSAAAAAAIRKSNPSQVHLLSKGFEDPGHNAHAALACMRAGSGMSPEQLSAALGKYPKMLDYSPEKLTKCFGFLGKSCGLNAKERGRVIAATPQVLGLSVEENLANKLHLLVHELGLGEDGAREAIVGFPQVLTYNTDSLRARFEYFLEDVGCTPNELVAMLASYPQGVITLSMDNIARSVRFVTDVFAHLPSDDYQRRNLGDGAPATLAARMICKNPTLLGYSVDRKMRPTVEYVSANYPACCAMQALKMCTSSLGGTVMTRCFFKERAGWNVQLVTVSLFLFPYGQLD